MADSVNKIPVNQKLVSYIEKLAACRIKSSPRLKALLSRQGREELALEPGTPPSPQPGKDEKTGPQTGTGAEPLKS